MSGQAQHGTRREPRRADTPPVRLNRSGGYSGGQFRELLADPGRENDLLDMLEFLRRTPPPDNYMSIPDNFSVSSVEDDKWKSKFKVFRAKRKKSKRKRRKPPTIRLPDSAVAGHTIGGHRHIAISIPLEYSHFGPNPPTQYPVFDRTGLDLVREIEARFGPMRTSTGERGTVTVLRPVEEGRESFISESTSPSRDSSIPQDRLASLHAPPPPRQAPVEHVSTMKALTQSMQTPRSSRYMEEEEDKSTGNDAAYGFSPFGRAEKQSGSRPTSPITPLEAQSAGPSTQTRASGAADIQSRFVFPLPPRGSSKGKQRAEVTRPIDDILGPLSPLPSSQGMSHSSRIYSARQSVAESIGSLRSEPHIYDAQTAQAYSSIPIIVKAPSQQKLSTLSPSGTNRRVQIDDPAQPLAEGSAQSRRDRARAMKQKDAAETTGSLLPGSTGISPESSGESKESPPVEHSSGDPRATRPVAPSVARDLEGQTGVTGNLTSSEQPRREGPSPGTERSSSSSQLSFVTGPDRISLSRRREQRTQREQAKIAHDAARASSGQLSQQQQLRTPRVSETPSRERDIIRRYEDLREQRHRDMEKRLRRLERNGDVWLQSLVPLMEGLSRLLQEQYIYQRNVNSRFSFSEAEGAPGPSEQQTARVVSPREQQFYQSLPLRSQSTRSHDVPLQRERAVSAMGTIPTRIAEHQRQPQTSRPRPHSIQIPDSGRPSAAQRLAGAGAGSGGRSSSGGTPVTARRISPLQAEFERELAARRAREARDDDLDARIAELEEQQLRHQWERHQRQQARASRGPGRSGMEE